MKPGPESETGPPRPGLTRRLAAEWIGTALLLATVVGSGIMGERLAGGSVGLALLANTLATGAGLVVLILVFGPVSGAHFNPAVTAAFAVRGEITVPAGLAYAASQIAGGLVGVLTAHLMFDEPLLQASVTARDGAGLLASEAVATFGLVTVILGCVRFRPEATAFAVGLFITSAYWFTASTSFANPAVTIARAFSDTFAGIAPASVAGFIGAQFAGAFAAVGLASWLFGKGKS